MMSEAVLLATSPYKQKEKPDIHSLFPPGNVRLSSQIFVYFLFRELIIQWINSATDGVLQVINHEIGFDMSCIMSHISV